MPAFVRRHRVLLLHLSFWGAYCSFFFYQLNQEYGVRNNDPAAWVRVHRHRPPSAGGGVRPVGLSN